MLASTLLLMGHWGNWISSLAGASVHLPTRRLLHQRTPGWPHLSRHPVLQFLPRQLVMRARGILPTDTEILFVSHTSRAIVLARALTVLQIQVAVTCVQYAWVLTPPVVPLRAQKRSLVLSRLRSERPRARRCDRPRRASWLLWPWMLRRPFLIALAWALVPNPPWRDAQR